MERDPGRKMKQPLEYFAVYGSLWGHRKHLKLSRILKISKLQAYAVIVSVFRAAAEREPDGDFSKYDPDDLADICGWDTEPAPTMESLIKSEILSKDKQLVKWTERQPIFKARERIAEFRKNRDKSKGEQKQTEINCTVQNGTEISGNIQKQGEINCSPSPSPSYSPSLSVSSFNVSKETGELKKEESDFEENFKDWGPGCAEDFSEHFNMAILKKTGKIGNCTPPMAGYIIKELTAHCRQQGYTCIRDKIPRFLEWQDTAPQSGRNVYLLFCDWIPKDGLVETEAEKIKKMIAEDEATDD